MEINNLDNLDEEYVWKDAVGLITKSLGDSVSSQGFYVNIDIVPPDAYSTKYHSHTQQEEFFLILEGEGTLRLNDNESLVKKGDFIGKIPGKNIAHTFYNSSKQDMMILDIGTREKEDTCYYPDEKMYMQKSNIHRRYFHENDLKQNWTSYPNE